MTKLWLIRRTDRIWYDEYDSCVVAADTEEEALTYHPNGYVRSKMVDGYRRLFWDSPDSTLHGEPYNCHSGWASIDNLTIEYLGTTDRDIKGVVLASFNAG